MPYFTPNDIDIDVDEFVDSCSASEVQQLIKYLEKNHYIKAESQLNVERQMSVGETFYVEAIENLADKYHMLTKEEEELIIKLSKRF
jgi:hypothetical protein